MESIVRVGRFNAQDDIYRFSTEDVVAIIDPSTLILNDVTEGVEQLTFVSVQNARFRHGHAARDGMIEFRGALSHFGDAFFDYTVRDQFGRSPPPKSRSTSRRSTTRRSASTTTSSTASRTRSCGSDR